MTLCTTPPHDATITACIAQHAARLYPAVLKHLTEQHPPDAAPTTTTTSTTATTTPAHVIAGYIKLAHPTRLPDATIRATCIAALEPMCAQLVTSCQQAQGQQHGQQQDLAVPLLSMLKGGHAGDPVHHVRACCAQVVPAVVAAVGTGVSVVSGVEILCRLVQVCVWGGGGGAGMWITLSLSLSLSLCVCVCVYTQDTTPRPTYTHIPRIPHPQCKWQHARH